MPRPSIPPEQKLREGQFLLEMFLRAKERDESITQESIAFELEMTQGNFNHWIKGRSHIPDNHFIWLGKRLGFNPVTIRPRLADYKLDTIMSPREKRIFAAYQADPEFRKSVDAIAEMSAVYRATEVDAKSAAAPDHPATDKNLKK